MSATGRYALARLEAILPGGPLGRRLGLLAMIDSTGTGAFLAVSAIFLTRSVGLSVAQVGIGLSVMAAIGLISTVPAGILADQFGPRRILVLVSLWRAACFLAYPFTPSFGWYLVLMCVLGLVDKVAAPMEQALIGQVVGEDDRIRTMAGMRSLRNVGFTVGALLGTVALLVDTRLAYILVLFANAASFVALAVIAVRLPLEGRSPVPRVKRLESLRILSSDRPYLALAWLNALLTLHMPLLSIGLPLWIAGHSHAPRAIVAPLLAVNTVLAVALQVRASRGAETATGAARRLRHAGYALAACCLLLAVLPPLPTGWAIALLVLAMVALTGGELFQSAGGWGLSYSLARPGQEGAYLSLFWLGVTAQQIVAPALVAGVVLLGPAAWGVVAGVMVAAGLACAPVTRWAVAARGRERAAEPAGAMQ